jgi:alpha-L-arabinofuranosidase
MYSDLLEPEVVVSEASSDPLQIDQNSVRTFDIVVTTSANRKRVAAAVVNRHPSSPCALAVEVRGGPPLARITTLAGDAPEAYNDVAHPARVTPGQRQFRGGAEPIELPPHSVSIVEWAE